MTKKQLVESILGTLYSENLTKEEVNALSDDQLIEWLNTNSYAFDWIDDPSEEVQLHAVNVRSGNIQHIKKPYGKVQLLAVTSDGNTFHHIKKPTEEVKLYIAKNHASL